MPFPPIAIVGRGCVLPGGVFDPAGLWQTVAEGRVHLSPVPEGRWGLPTQRVVGKPGVLEPDRAWHCVGGYVEGFDERFDATGFALPAGRLESLDTSFRWVLHAAREALREAGIEGAATSGTGLVLGNLSFPSPAMTAYAEDQWRAGEARPAAAGDPRARFSSALPAHLAARALGLGAGAHALDAACASSLYALKLACDRLHERTADVMLAGAVNGADGLFVHVGFTALSALSPTGRSRPFHPEADGLVPAEGAVLVALMRLEDAVAQGRRVLGVVRAAGLANDGRASGLLVPSEEGQERAMRAAYEGARIDPASVSLLECHATGTPVGDSTEVRSSARVFRAAPDLPIGSAKGNFGHLITAAGGAGLLKVLGAMEAGVRPGTPGVDDESVPRWPTAPMRIVREAEEWPGARRAAVSAFGFGGNNAHVVVDAWEEGPDKLAQRYGPGQRKPRRGKQRKRAQVAVVAVGARVGDGLGAGDLARALFEGGDLTGRREQSEVDLDGLPFPPRDLAAAHSQQLLILEAAREAASGVRLPRERTMVLTGMGCDPEPARFGARLRAPDAERDAFGPPLDAAGVLGTMANITANRVNAQLDLAGPSFAVHAEEASGLAALDIAARAIRSGEADAALVGAVDLSHEPVHQAALAALGRERPPGDAAVVLALKSLALAKKDGDSVLALIEETEQPAGLRIGDAWPSEPQKAAREAAPVPHFDPATLCGVPHAANGLLAVAVAVLALHHQARPSPRGIAQPWLASRVAQVRSRVLEAPAAQVTLQAADVRGLYTGPVPRLYMYSGPDRAGVLDALSAATESSRGPARLALVAAGPNELDELRQSARRWLLGEAPQPLGAVFRETPVVGEIAFTFGSGAATYAGMGRELALAAPDLVRLLQQRAGSLQDIADWLYNGDGKPKRLIQQVWGASYLSQLHALVTRDVLRITPQATVGYSSGETSALISMGAWTDLSGLCRDTGASTLFTEELTGSFEAVRRVWRREGIEGERWTAYLVGADATQVRRALEGEPAVHLMGINSPDCCTLGGEPGACARVLRRLAPEYEIPLGYEMAAHAPVLNEVRDAWRQLHLRPTRPVPGVRFYTCGTHEHYTASANAAADAFTSQVVNTVDFVGTVERAWQDGVRIFIEHGPKSLCTDWIRRILGEREHLAVALDAPDRHDVRHLMRVVAELAAAGVPLDSGALHDLLAAASPPRPQRGGRQLTFPAHPPAVRLADPQPLTAATRQAEPAAHRMAAAPALPPVRVADTYPPGESAACAPSGGVPRPPNGRVPSPTAGTAPLSPRLQAPLPRGAAATGTAHPAATIAAHHSAVAQSHQTFLALQDQLHQRFLTTRGRASALLLRTAPPTSPVTTAAPRPGDSPPTPPGPPAPTASTGPAASAGPAPLFSRSQLEHLASGRISDLFGPLFAAQDGYARQTRMPRPPMLLADRVTSIDAEPATLGTGTIRTETDVPRDAWYLDPTGRMPAGIMVEAGQADLLLISWLGIDLVNRGERAYRLLGCELTYHASPPVPGETLRYEITIDGHAEHNGIRLFFFRYECRDATGALRLSVRNGQAGFFTDAELADSQGVLWSPSELPAPSAAAEEPPLTCTRSGFGPEQIRAFAAGRPADCFGPGWEETRAHVRTPRIADGKMLLLDEVTDFDPSGGPHGLGYLRAELPLRPDSWFFDGHFHNDPCMPGTLMFEGCLQAMAVHMTALGHTVTRDGWRFEPEPGRTVPMRCRGQATPDSRLLVYEVYVTQMTQGPEPTLVADLLCTVDGVKAFHAQGVALRLVPDWPLSHWRDLGPPAQQRTSAPVPPRELGGLVGHSEQRPVATAQGVRFDYGSLLACAWGRPTEAFGSAYASLDGPRRMARLPGPPYHFMSRVIDVEGPLGGMRPGSRVTAEYDVPDEVWYRSENGNPTMPFSVLLEVALQPCGWLASYTGEMPQGMADLLFRNLDGTGTVVGEVPPGTRVLRSEVELVEVSRFGGMVIESFTVRCRADGHTVFTLDTVFGFFPPESFADQAGLPASDEERTRLALPCARTVDLTERPARYCSGELRLPGPMLLMIDQVTGYWPDGGAAGLGRLRAQKRVDPGEWFFRAHFFQDPVQPGSLGLEAMVQLLQFHLLETGAGDEVPHPRFEPLMTGREFTWKYRGQVVPSNSMITVEMEITEAGTDALGPYAVAEAWLWVDGLRIYHAAGIGMRVVSGTGGQATDRLVSRLDPELDRWLGDHRPNHTVPCLPMMSVANELATAVARRTGRRVTEVRDVQLRRWVTVTRPVTLRVEAEATQTPGEWAARLRVWPDQAEGETETETETETEAETDRRTEGTAWADAPAGAEPAAEPAAEGRVLVGEPAPPPTPFAPLADLETIADIYVPQRLPHGPAFHYLTELRMGGSGSSAVLDAAAGSVPYGLLHQGLLDALTHTIPHADLGRWSSDVQPGLVAYPHRIDHLRFHDAVPRSGRLSVETRFVGFEDVEHRHPVIDVQVSSGGRVLISLRLIELLYPADALLAAVPPRHRGTFYRDRRPAPGSRGISSTERGVTTLSARAVHTTDWIPGTLAHIYRLPAELRGRERMRHIAVADHVAWLADVHPSEVEVAPDARTATLRGGSRRTFPVQVTHLPGGLVQVTDDDLQEER